MVRCKAMLDRYEDLWRERVERVNQLLADSPKGWGGGSQTVALRDDLEAKC